MNGRFTAVRSVAAHSVNQTNGTDHVAQTYIYTLSSKCLCPDITIMVNWAQKQQVTYLLTYSKHLMYNNSIVILMQSTLMYAHEITHTHSHTHILTHSSHRMIIYEK